VYILNLHLFQQKADKMDNELPSRVKGAVTVLVKYVHENGAVLKVADAHAIVYAAATPPPNAHPPILLLELNEAQLNALFNAVLQASVSAKISPLTQVASNLLTKAGCITSPAEIMNDILTMAKAVAEASNITAYRDLIADVDNVARRVRDGEG